MVFSSIHQQLVLNSPLFIGIEDDFFSELLESSSLLDLSAGEVLIWPGDVNDRLYFILHGRLGVKTNLADAAPIALMGEGEYVGEMSLLGDDRHTAYTLAATDCKLIAFNLPTLWKLIEHSHQAAINMLKMMANRIRIEEPAIDNNFEQRYGFARPILIDEITGDYEWSHTKKIFERLLLRSARYNLQSCLVLLEIDHFKNYADFHGELGGDQAVRAIELTILNCMRPHDLIGHLYDSRFAILLSNVAHPKDCLVAAERLIKMVSETTIILPSGDNLPSVTVSIGLSASKPEDDLLNLSNRAEQALQQAQTKGGNCVVEFLPG